MLTIGQAHFSEAILPAARYLDRAILIPSHLILSHLTSSLLLAHIDKSDGDQNGDVIGREGS
jgi:hypothetical protein